MLVLIAESKTMLACCGSVTASEYMRHRPLSEKGAEEIMRFLSGCSAGELAERIGVSTRLAADMTRMVHDFPDKSRGEEAISAYTGVVFKALDYASLSEDAKTRCKRTVRIIASLYGWLRPDDVIKAYRLDYTSPVAPGGGTLANYWKEKVTEYLRDCLTAGGVTEILDLLPGDAAKLIDRKAISQTVKVWKVDFMEIQPGGDMKRPNASKLKTLRGRLLRQILTEGIDSPEGLKGLESDIYCFHSMNDDATIVFHTVK